MKYVLTLRILCDGDTVDDALGDARYTLKLVDAALPTGALLTPVAQEWGLWAGEMRDDNMQQAAIITLQQKKG